MTYVLGYFSGTEQSLEVLKSLGFTHCCFLKLSQLEHRANSTKVVGSTPMWAIQLRAGLGAL